MNWRQQWDKVVYCHRSCLLFSPEHDYRYVLYLLSQTRPSVVSCLSVTFLHPTQGVKNFRNISSLLYTWAVLWPPCKILRRSRCSSETVPGTARLLLTTNRKSKMPFPMVLNSMTFNDLEPTYRMYFQHFFTTSVNFGSSPRQAEWR